MENQTNDMTIAEAAKLRGVVPQTIRDWTRRGLSSRRIGPIILVPRDAVMTFDPGRVGRPPRKRSKPRKGGRNVRS